MSLLGPRACTCTAYTAHAYRVGCVLLVGQDAALCRCMQWAPTVICVNYAIPLWKRGLDPVYVGHVAAVCPNMTMLFARTVAVAAWGSSPVVFCVK